MESLDEYIAAHIDPEPPTLHELWRQTNLRLLYPHMASGHLQGRLLAMLSQMIQPRLVLELGTYSGYSTLCLAEGMAAGGALHTVEVNDEQECFTRPWLDQSPHARDIQLHIGDALQVVPALHLSGIDLVFIDADKRHYADYYRLVLPLVRHGGYILADNTLWGGHVVEADHQRDAQTLGIERFNDLVARDTRVSKVILPLRDGLTLIRKH